MAFDVDVEMGGKHGAAKLSLTSICLAASNIILGALACAVLHSVWKAGLAPFQNSSRRMLGAASGALREECGHRATSKASGTLDRECLHGHSFFLIPLFSVSNLFK